MRDLCILYTVYIKILTSLIGHYVEIRIPTLIFPYKIVHIHIIPDFKSSDTISFTYSCGDNPTVEQQIKIEYPYNIAESNPDFKMPKSSDDCSITDPITLQGDLRSV